jgi:hypothetical protein
MSYKSTITFGNEKKLAAIPEASTKTATTTATTAATTASTTAASKKSIVPGANNPEP